MDGSTGTGTWPGTTGSARECQRSIAARTCCDSAAGQISDSVASGPSTGSGPSGAPSRNGLSRTAVAADRLKGKSPATRSATLRRGACLAALIAAAALPSPPASMQGGVDQSPPPILQWFESSYQTIESRLPDIFMAGYGFVWLPPPYRADQGGFSVGYDVYDRFELGKPGNPTLYGTEEGLKTLATMLHRAGVDQYLDQALPQCFEVDGAGGRCHDQAHARRDPVPTEDAGGQRQILELAVGARSDEALVDLHAGHGADRRGVVDDAPRQPDVRLDGTEVDADASGEHGIVVGPHADGVITTFSSKLPSQSLSFASHSSGSAVWSMKPKHSTMPVVALQ